MIYFTEIGKKGQPILFQFYDRELPEEIPFPKQTVLNKIKYPGGHQTNQIIGTYRGELEWTGMFYGNLVVDGKIINAKQRADAIEELMGRPLRVGFPVGGQTNGKVPGQVPSNQLAKTDKDFSGYVGIYIIEEFVPTIRNYLNIEYRIKLVPHERQEKIKPEKTTNTRVKLISGNLNLSGLSGPAKKAGKKTQAHAKKAMSSNGKTLGLLQPQQVPDIDLDHKAVYGTEVPQ
jgi:hypothetical protein